ncbi:type I secretion C-terminal target domain-containing protein, partial [Mesorhizobium sp. B2-4-14]|uniref:beta strand repeat-containing protein n=1 Tax=Mesorhizobium sp. B2-4-14 TaxID=2589935 RepID=UPI001129648C
VVVTDADPVAHSAQGNLTITIVDDAPVANADNNSVASGSHAAIIGNVLTGVGETAPAAGTTNVDVFGADGKTGGGVVGVAAGTTGGGVDANVGQAIHGLYGTLTLNANGGYSYQRDAGSPGGVSDKFTYTIKDGDGDLAHTTLTIDIASGTPQIGANTPDNGSTAETVYEAGLANGSQVGPTATTTSGAIAFTSPDGVSSVTLGGHTLGLGAGNAVTFPDAAGTVSAYYTYDGAAGTGTIHYVYTLTTNELESPAANNGQDSLETKPTFQVVVTDADPVAHSAQGNLTITIVDDAPTVIAPDAAVMLNTAGTTFTGKLDFDDNVDNNYGADGGNTRFASSLNGTDSTFTSGGRHILYSVSGDGHTLTGFLDTNGDSSYTAGTDTPVFTVALNLDGSFAAANDTYTVNLIGTIDGGAQSINFNDGNIYQFVGGNTAWVGYVDKTAADPLTAHDLLVTPLSVSGSTVASGGTMNGTANALGVSGGASIGSGEGARVDYVTGLAGTPGSSGDYGTSTSQNETYTGHYDVNGATVSFALTGSKSTSVELSAYVDTSADNSSGGGSVMANDGTPDSVTGVTIKYGAGSTVFNYAGHALNTFYVVAVGGHNFTVEFVNTSGTIHAIVGGIVDGTTLGVYGATNYNALQVDYYGTNHISANGTSVTSTTSDTFQISGFGTTSITPGLPVDMHLPVNVVDGDGDVAHGIIGVYLMPSSPTTADHSADSAAVSHVYTATASQPDVIGSLYDDTISAAGVSGNHILYGGAGGSDTLTGGAGNDTLIASSGNNTLTGGAGADIFVINAATWTSHGSIQDLIADYHPGEGDTVDLSKVLDAVFGGSQTQADTFSSVSATNDGTNVHVNVTHGGSTVEVATLTANAGISHTINIVYDDAHHATTVNVP